MSSIPEPTRPPSQPSGSPASSWRSRRGASLIALFVAGSLAVGFVAASLIGGPRENPVAQGESPSPYLAVSESPSASQRPSPSPSVPVPTATPLPTPAPITSTDAMFSLLPAEAPAGFESSITCDGEIGPSDPVAIVALKTGEEFVTTTVLRDYADLDEPRTVCTFGDGNFWVSDLIDARHVLINVEGIHAIVDLPEVRYHWFALPQVEGGYANLLTVSPGLDAVIWTRESYGDVISREVMITTDAGDAVVAALPAVEGGRCGSSFDSKFADYRFGGEHYYALDQLTLGLNALIVANGAETELAMTPPTGGEWEEGMSPTFPVWSPTEDVLYYRVGNDVMRWTPTGGAEIFLPDTPWFQPSMTADGRYLAYVVDSDLYLIDFTTTAAPQLIRENVRYPVFVNGSQIWFLDASDAGCVGEATAERIYDVRDGSEGPSVIQNVQAVWPQTSSNH